MDLSTIWFILIAILFTGYFVLEGFDFGVGILLPLLGRDDRQRRVLINTIGPVWDGNEVWVLTAGGAMFAAFPEWYATLFSGFYLPLLLILVALILRGVAFEYRGKRDDPQWKSWWDRAIFFGSLLPALLWGVAFGNIVRGVRLDATHEYVGGFWALLNPYALLGGLVTLSLFTTHGAVFLALKTTGEIRERANVLAGRTGLAAAALAVGFLAWTLFGVRGGAAAAVLAMFAALALVGGLAANLVRREGWAFAGTAAAIALAVACLFAALFPDVLPSIVDPANSLTVDNASSTSYTLKIMTWVAVVFTPIVLAYQGWTYWVFRKRIGVDHIPQA
ncbi:cytochrome d ubiquinol oxidase subunit II [Phytohabitans aurantiacus]|uniref:Cytochrome c oxidase assembly protein n=1 Tax=Phytohabitans aurantiacus TaxID=3016789 RepID=A0ABQ5R4D2_9ACTN|nr:cytochrome d ubiquinol oxidase subunit II [Phytohabitans aurantiacus]GLI01068.1 cytochrome c oxidase assembly protein [Phytohabitans aurantiacus]